MRASIWNEGEIGNNDGENGKNSRNECENGENDRGQSQGPLYHVLHMANASSAAHQYHTYHKAESQTDHLLSYVIPDPSASNLHSPTFNPPKNE